jgi:poly-gamma-glutamate synthesis protein (capsule biosynthesis protein)
VEARIRKYGLGWPFEKVSEALQSADLAFCNLECPLSLNGIKVPKRFCFKADPNLVHCLIGAGFDIVSLANNHTLDCNRNGLVETMHYLDKWKVGHVGAGKTSAYAALPRFVDVNGLRIAFLARNELLPEGVWVRPDAPGIAHLEPDRLVDEVSRSARQADVVIVSLHWGVEYRKTPEKEQVKLARKLVDAGADMVLGHHPHVIQPVEKYHGGVIAYSMGNFVFDSPFKKCRDSVMLKCRLSPSGVSNVEAIPVKIVDFRPVAKSS